MPGRAQRMPEVVQVVRHLLDRSSRRWLGRREQHGPERLLIDGPYDASLRLLASGLSLDVTRARSDLNRETG